MSLQEELAAKTQNALEKTALNFAINVRDILIEKAEKGEREYFIQLNDKYVGLATSAPFIDLLSELLDGVKIEVIERIVFSMFKQKYLKISW